MNRFVRHLRGLEPDQLETIWTALIVLSADTDIPRRGDAAAAIGAALAAVEQTLKESE
jgi:hypothetical protein